VDCAVVDDVETTLLNIFGVIVFKRAPVFVAAIFMFLYKGSRRRYTLLHKSKQYCDKTLFIQLYNKKNEVDVVVEIIVLTMIFLNK